MNHPSTPPPANTIVILSADILATRAGELLDQLACGSWAPAQKLREALACYSECRLGVAVRDATDPQAMQLANWQPPADCAGPKCRHHGRCNHVKGDDCFEPRSDKAPVTERSIHHA